MTDFIPYIYEKDSYRMIESIGDSSQLNSHEQFSIKKTKRMKACCFRADAPRTLIVLCVLL